MGDMDMMEQPPMPAPPADPSMMMGDDPNAMGDDPNAMPPADMGADPNIMGDEQMTDSGVDKSAEQDAGNLSNILGNANAETANYVGNMIASALGKNPELNGSDKQKMANKILGNKDSEQEGADENAMQESRNRINALIDEALNSILYDTDNQKRSNKKLEQGYMRDIQNPFVSPKNL